MAADATKTLVVVGVAFSDVAIERDAAAPWGVWVERREVSEPQAIAAAVGDAAGLLVQYIQVDAATIEACESLRVIGRYGVGLDNIDVEAAERRGVAVVNVPDYAVEEVATHALALTLAAWRKLALADSLVRRGRWADWETLAPIAPLSDATLGLIGVGRIGGALAGLAAPIFGRVVAHDPYATALPDGVEALDLESLLASSDAVSLHVPLNASTQGLMGAERFAQMRPGSLLVNVSRGAVVDIDALVAALDAGRPAAAALDVLATEPPPTGHPLLGHPGVLMTPHVAWYSTRSVGRLRHMLADRCAALLAG